jgi:hypothetical protein
MLHEFLTANRKELVARCRNKVAIRLAPSEIPIALDHGVPLFLQQLVETLRMEQREPPGDTVKPGPAPDPMGIGRAASVHGAELLRLGYTVDQVVHEYGDVCQAVTELAGEEDEHISTGEFHALNRCLDNAIADAVTSFGRARQVLIDDQAETLEQRLSFYSIEHRRLVDIALQSYSAIQTGHVGVTGSTGTLLFHTLEELRSLANRTLPEIRRAYLSSPVCAPKTAQGPVEVAAATES